MSSDIVIFGLCPSTTLRNDVYTEMAKHICSSNEQRRVIQRCILMTTDPGDLVLDPTCGSRHDSACRGAVGQALDNDRHKPRGAGACPRSHHGRALPVLPTLRQRGRDSERKRRLAAANPRTHRHTAVSDKGFVYERVPHITLREHSQQRRNRYDMGRLPANAGTTARRVERRAR